MELCDLLLSKSNTIISVIETDGTIKFESDALIRVLGYSPDERRGVNALDYIHPDDLPEVKSVLADLITDNEGSRDYQFRYRHYDSSWRWLAVTGQNFLSHPVVKGIIVNARDITDLKLAESQIEKQEASLQMIIENLPMAVFAHNLDGSILYVNENSARYTGYTKQELLTMSVSDIDDDVVTRNDREQIWNNLGFGKMTTFHVTHIRKDRSTYTAEISLSSVMINDEPVLLAAALDISDRIKSEEALRESEEKYRQLNAAKDKFFRIISHDLRGPVGSILNLAQLLKERFISSESSDRALLINRLEEAAESTMNLLTDLLEWSRAQTDRIDLNPEKMQIFDFVNCNLDLVREQADAKEIELINEVEKDLTMFAERQSMNTVLRNLLSNAIKFTMPGGGVTIIARKLSYSDHEYVQLEVKDTGVGIPKARAEKLFSLEHADSTRGTENETGTGLGLIVCKEFVAKNKGRLTFTSEENKGTSFYVDIPLA